MSSGREAAKWGTLLALGVLAAAGAARAERLPMQADVDLCALRAADLGDSALSGTVRLEIMTRADGKVYAAFVHSAKGLADKVFEFCLASNALLWQYPPIGLDASGPFPITVISGGASSGSLQSRQTPPQVFLPSEHPEVEPAELEVARAQVSLNVLDDATLAEHGLALLAVHEYPEAIAKFRAALEKDGSDRIALRGLAQALAESGGDLAEARAVAAKLISIAPDSVVGFEAMLRVCAAAKDDACVFESWKQARVASDVAPRSRILHDELQPLVEKAAIRLKALALERSSQAAAKTRDAGPAAPVDPCASEPEPEKQALCEVKRCLDAGSALYAQEISKDGVEFEVGDWRFKEAGKDRLLMTRPISSKAKEGAAVVHRDAIFLVKIGEKFSIAPSSAEARAIAREHSACAATPAPANAAPAGAADAGTPAQTPAAPTTK